MPVSVPVSVPVVSQGSLETERKFAAGENKSTHRGHMNMKKLDEETEEFQREFSLAFLWPWHSRETGVTKWCLHSCIQN